MDLTRHCFHRFDISCRIFCTAYPSTERQDALPCSGTLTRSFNCTSSAMTREQQVSLRNEPPIQHKLREKLAVGSSRMPNCSGGPTHRLVTRSLENSQSPRRYLRDEFTGVLYIPCIHELSGRNLEVGLKLNLLLYNSLATIAFPDLFAR